jgi:hypothetical protein
VKRSWRPFSATWRPTPSESYRPGPEDRQPLQIAARAAICKGPGGGCLNLRRQHVLRAAASPRLAGFSKPSQNSPAAEIRLIVGHDVGHSEKKNSTRANMARQMHSFQSQRGLRSPPHRNFEVGPPITPVVRSSAPDPYGQDRVLLSGQRPHFFLFFAVMRGFCRQTLDACGLGALLCGVPGGWISALRERVSVPVGPA